MHLLMFNQNATGICMKFLKNKNDSKLQSQLFFLWLIVFIPFLIIQILFAYSWIITRYHQELNSNIELARSISHAFSEFVYDVFRDEAILGMVIVRDSTSIKTANKLLEAADSQYLAVKQIFYVSSTKEVLASSKPNYKMDSTVFSSIKNIPDTSRTYVGNLVENLFKNKPGFIISHTIHISGENNGFVVALIDPSQFSRGVMNLAPLDQGSFTLFDQNGTLVYSNLYPDIRFDQRKLWIGRDSLLARAMRGEVASGSYVSPIDGSKLVGSRTPTLNFWVAGAGRPQSVVFKSLIQTFGMSIFFTLASVFISLVFGRKIINTIVQALNKLQLHANALSTGNFLHTTPKSGVVEFDLLVNDFNQLGMQLKERDEKIKIRTEELQRSNGELEQFSYIASHDLQEPLRTIAGYLQLIDRRYKNKLDKDADEFIDFAVGGAHRLQSIINDLLQYSRIGTRGKPFVSVPVDTIIQEILDSIHTSIKESGAEIIVNDMPTISADPNQMKQLFQNLISNGIKFTKDKQPKIKVSAKKQTNEWLFSVTDYGIGISHEYFSKIFEPFKRLHTQDKYPGTGIGLTICRKIVERHGGRIWVESTPDKGSTFFFTIPDRGE